MRRFVSRSAHIASFYLVAVFTFVARCQGFTVSPLFYLHTNHARISETRLQAVGKSGGKMIETEDQYNSLVLSDETPKPVLVFFSAPWW